MKLPRRYRRRLLAVMLGAGLLPLLALGALGYAALGRALSLSPTPLDRTLQRADAALAGGDARLREELRLAQLSLVQAELARRSLLKLLPAALVGSLAVGAAALALGAVLLGRALARPVAQLTSEMAQLSRGDLLLPRAELPDAERDELQFLLARLRETAAQLLEQRARLQISEGLAAWREVARELSHELKNPLTAMKMAVARLDRIDDARVKDAAALLTDEIDMLLRLTQSFATFARLPAPSMARLELRPLLAEVCALHRQAAPVEVQLDAPEGLALLADADQLRRAFGNLVKNAVEASRAGDGPVRVQAARDAGRVRITVADGGAGIARPLSGADLSHPSATTKPGGSGLGLPIAHKIVHEHGGSLRLLPAQPKGTRAEIDLPEAV
jgi:nitrogen fixation/metabolism regulation signal transduction histidine kinase